MALQLTPEKYVAFTTSRGTGFSMGNGPEAGSGLCIRLIKRATA